MRISGSLPTHIARAYGVATARNAQNVAATGPLAPKPDVVRISGATSSDAVARVQPTQSPASAQRIEQLIAGRVSQPIQFDLAEQQPPAAPGALPFYTRQADRAEAAVALQVGRSIDVTG